MLPKNSKTNDGLFKSGVLFETPFIQNKCFKSRVSFKNTKIGCVCLHGIRLKCVQTCRTPCTRRHVGSVCVQRGPGVLKPNAKSSRNKTAEFYKHTKTKKKRTVCTNNNTVFCVAVKRPDVGESFVGYHN